MTDSDTLFFINLFSLKKTLKTVGKQSKNEFLPQPFLKTKQSTHRNSVP